MVKLRCGKCNYDISYSTRYCPNCGHQLGYPYEDYTNSNGSGGAGLVLLLLALAIGLYLVMLATVIVLVFIFSPGLIINSIAVNLLPLQYDEQTRIVILSSLIMLSGLGIWMYQLHKSELKVWETFKLACRAYFILCIVICVGSLILAVIIPDIGIIASTWDVLHYHEHNISLWLDTL